MYLKAEKDELKLISFGIANVYKTRYASCLSGIIDIACYWVQFKCTFPKQEFDPGVSSTEGRRLKKARRMCSTDQHLEAL